MQVELWLLSSNRHKYLEIESIAREYGIRVIPVEGLKLEIQDDELSNIALTAAVMGYSILRKPVLVEDAGLFVEALNGFPGPYSSYVFKTIGVNGILKLMSGLSNRDACFKSYAVAIYNDRIVKGYGEVCGYITSEPRGDKGFGFDPIFAPLEQPDKTFAEMSVEEKNRYSHRARAVRRVFDEIASIAGTTLRD